MIQLGGPKLQRIEKFSSYADEQKQLHNKKEEDSLRTLPLTLDYTPQSHRQGLATYFRSYLRGFMKDWTSKNFKNDSTKYNLYVDGLRNLYNHKLPKMQKYAEESVEEHMINLQKNFLFKTIHCQQLHFWIWKKRRKKLL